MTAARVLILGATGNIGAPLVASLLARGHAVRVGLRREALNKAPAGAERAELDFESPSTYRRALAGADRVFLLVPASPSMPEWAGAVAREARRQGVERIVKVSALGAAPRASFAFGRWHGAADEAVSSSGVGCVLLKPNGFMQNFIHAYGPPIRARSVFRNSLGDARVSYVDARDIAAAAARLLTADETPAPSYELTGPEALTQAEAAAHLSLALGREVRYEPIAVSDAEGTMARAGVAPWMIAAILELHASYRRGEGAVVSSGVADITGRPASPFRTFALEHKEHFQ